MNKDTINKNYSIYCEYHKEEIDEENFNWKGCWNCHYLKFGNLFPYVDESEASKILGKSTLTIRRWIVKGKLEGTLFEQHRFNGSINGNWKKLYVSKESIDRLKRGGSPFTSTSSIFTSGEDEGQSPVKSSKF
ncbi:MAG: hypothetical protein QXQ46_07190 [Thermoplasmatales archaeon]